MEEIKALNDDEMEQAAGGQLNRYPNDDKLKELGLWDYVRNMEKGWGERYYDTWREEDKEWKHVASDHMLQYVERTLGADDPRYQALNDYCQHGSGQGITTIIVV